MLGITTTPAYHQQWVLTAICLLRGPIPKSHHNIFLQPVLVATILSLVPLKGELEVKAWMQVVYLGSDPELGTWEEKQRRRERYTISH